MKKVLFTAAQRTKANIVTIDFILIRVLEKSEVESVHSVCRRSHFGRYLYVFEIKSVL